MSKGELIEIMVSEKTPVMVGDIAIPHSNNNGHNYPLGAQYTIVTIMGSASSTLTSLNCKGADGEVGNNLMIQDARIYRYKKVFKAGKAKIMETLILPEEMKNIILATINQAREDVFETIFSRWGFEETIEKGRGIIILFWGPPGTGKTKCAEGIAEILRKETIFLDSGNFQSPIPGACEKLMSKAFSDATEKKSIIVLDECDSVLYNRNQVGAILSAEINHLLGCIEKFDGICIMTTNRPITLDPALERRVALKLEFKNPERHHRKQIWRALIPKKCPLDRDVDLDALSEFELNGGKIKNAVLTAARVACAEKQKAIAHRHLEMGIKREIEGIDAWTKTSTNSLFNLNSSMSLVGTLKKKLGIEKKIEIKKEEEVKNG